MSDQVIKAIDARLNGIGREILEESERAGLDPALSCAVIQQESNGRNVFGHDFGESLPDAPPYSGHPVTKERIQKLINQPGYKSGKAKMNGVGPAQLTWYEFVLQAERLGGAHIPRNNCRVAFDLLANYIINNEYMWALELYNGDDGKPGSPYANSVAQLHHAWKGILAEARKGTGYPTVWAKPDAKRWLRTAKGEYIRLSDLPDATMKSDKDGWVYLSKAAPPAKGGLRHPGSGPYVERHPTHFNWRADLRELVDEVEAEYYGQIYICTYRDHPPGWGLDAVSLDVWDAAGRGAPLDPAIWQEVFDRFFHAKTGPYIRWTISSGEIWTPSQGWQPWPDTDPASDAAHRKHFHITYF